MASQVLALREQLRAADEKVNDLDFALTVARAERRYVRAPAGECPYCWRIGLYSQVALNL